MPRRLVPRRRGDRARRPARDRARPAMPVMREFWFPADETAGHRHLDEHRAARHGQPRLRGRRRVRARRALVLVHGAAGRDRPALPDGARSPCSPRSSAPCPARDRPPRPRRVRRAVADQGAGAVADAVLADKPVANTKLGRAKAIIESGHAYVRGRLAEQWDAVVRRPPPDDDRPRRAVAGRDPRRPDRARGDRAALRRGRRRRGLRHAAPSTAACATPAPRCSTSARRR